MKSPFSRLFVSATAVVAIGLSPSSATAATYVSDFATGLDGWQPQWHKESPSGTDGEVSHSTERGFNDSASLLFDMGDGLGDDGTLWIEKLLTIEPDVPTHVAVEFQQLSLVQSDLNTFEVKAVISTTDPNEQDDFTTIGSTDSVAGWAPFAHSELITSATGDVWIAVGIRVAWESPRDYWIDQVVVTTTPVPEPSAMALVGVAGVAFVSRWRIGAKQRTEGHASSDEPHLPAFLVAV